MYQRKSLINIPIFKDFSHATDQSQYCPLPIDWCIALSDIMGSTKALESGRYKEINFVGAAVIAAVTKECGSDQIHFVFGGDGATIAFPESLRSRVQTALEYCQKVSNDTFQIQLRVGIVSAKEIYESGNTIGLAYFQNSKDGVLQHLIMGSGVSYVDKLIKSRPLEPIVLQKAINKKEKPFENLECRWSPVKNRKGEILTLIVMARAGDDQLNSEIYQKVIFQIEKIYGGGAVSNPIQSENLKLSASTRDLIPEARIKAYSEGKSVGLKLLGLHFFNFIWNFIFSRNLTVFGINWGKYKADIQKNTDFRKMDDNFKTVLDGSSDARNQLFKYFDVEEQKGQLYYGFHVSSEALLTCLIFDRDKNHIHFVDGNDGGYSVAAKMLKSKIKEGSFTK